ncbi:hypothetical protein [Sphingobacterium detergens]|uniref:Putative membrane-anchored protein n=1 Tax=Sphingobacterium detergens TaxID=1145106 RepID=A0A420BH22_SPHD1|nr:hypothetical protein [Sphingobacterium detergens]RKE55998.1 putative membrane-anchored protein [Sphingobacterium detergens]
MKYLNKVAPITLSFWLMKVVATTLGETLGDFISMTLNYGYVVGLAITLVILVVALLIQLNAKEYEPVKYWFVIIGTTTLGTEISDFIDRTLHMGYLFGSIILALCLVASLLFWYRKYKNLEVYPIVEKKKELLFWIAVLFSNSLGTAFGDFLSDNLGLSYLHGAMVTGSIIILVVLLHYFTKLNQILLFWIAFIFTRPFGATFGDFLTKPFAKGGLELSTLYASLCSLVLMTIMIAIAHKKKA